MKSDRLLLLSLTLLLMVVPIVGCDSGTPLPADFALNIGSSNLTAFQGSSGLLHVTLEIQVSTFNFLSKPLELTNSQLQDWLVPLRTSFLYYPNSFFRSSLNCFKIQNRCDRLE